MTTSSVDREVLRAWRDTPTPDMIPVVVAAELCDVSYRQMDHWVRKGYIKAQERHKEKSGVERVLESQEFRVLQVFVPLVKAGFPPRVASDLAHGDLYAIARLEEALQVCVQFWSGEVPA